ncbi:MAG: ATP-dependent metallopeptidase FtsH/Yme1/Tma family protein, partial [Acidobacteriota bacterium]
MNSNVKSVIFWVVIICVVSLIFVVVRSGNKKADAQVTFSDFMQQVENNRVKSVTVTGTEVHGLYREDGSGLRTTVPPLYPDLYKILREKGVNIDIKDTSSSGLLSLVFQTAPFILLLGFWIFMMRQMQSGGNKALSFGKSRARLHSSQQKKVTFKDVAGVEEAKEELQEIIEFLR